ncbi:hypothetical protein [Streptomyces halobius]|uniref:Uncharacterized protein n=1 Tax=Streptomyces halobius TaxID=2879846 RepID=A0ABY4M057_9ACTN|nr:hypothetical protein [Streptomyces halobius]UQA90847.1 hypothetical protein K9S39_02205 [Streptomyces halobius]
MTPNHSDEPNTVIRSTTPTADSHDARLTLLETQVRTLADAVRTLAQGMEKIPTQDTPDEEAARGARLAHEILLAQGL